MYAAVVKLTVDAEKAPEASATFSARILPAITSAAGFRSGVWLDPSDGEGLSVIQFETEQQAQRLAQSDFDWSAPGVKILSVQIRRVAVAVP